MSLRQALVTTLLFGLFTLVASQCNRTQCNSQTTCDTGFGVELCTNGTSNVSYTNLCFYSTHCTTYSQKAGDLFVNLNGPSPDRVKGLHVKIQNAILNAYNKFCRESLNYLLCCPGSSSWPDQSNKSASVSAMADVAELPILSVIGSRTSTNLVIRLLPNRNSTLCAALTYATTAQSTTPTTAAITTSTTKAPVNNSTAAPNSTVSSANANRMNSSTTPGAASVPAGTSPGAASVPAGTTPGAASVPAGTTPGAASVPAGTTPGAASVPAGTTPGAASVPAGTTPGAASVPAGTTPGAASVPAGTTPGAASVPAVTSAATAPGMTRTTPVSPPTSPGPITGSTPLGSAPMTTGTVGVSSGTHIVITSTPAMSTTTSNKAGRRRRDLGAAYEEPFESDVVYLDREKRATGTSDLAIALSASAIQNITNGMNLSGVVETVLLQNSVNATASVSAATDPTTASPTATSVTVGRKSARSSFYSADIALTVMTIAVATIGANTACTQLMPV